MTASPEEPGSTGLWPSYIINACPAGLEETISMAVFDHDTLYGGLDNDDLYGQAGDDNLYGDEGNDFLDAGDGA